MSPNRPRTEVHSRGLRSLGLVLCLWLVVASGLRAQVGRGDLPNQVDVLDPPAVIAVNGVIGGMAGGVGHLIRGESIWSGAIEGLGGGALVGIGKYLTAQGRTLGWPGKITAALGTSVAHNAAKARDPLSAVGVDVGPVYLRLTRGDGGAVRLKPFLLPGSAAMTLRAFADGDELDLDDSLLAGTPIFASDQVEGGQTTFNVVRIGRSFDQVLINVNGDFIPVDRRRLILHERVHALQFGASRAVSPLVNPAVSMADRDPLEEVGLHTETLISFVLLDALDEALWEVPTPLEAEALSLFQ